MTTNNAINTVVVPIQSVLTTDATPTELYSWPLDECDSIAVSGFVKAVSTDTSDMYFANFTAAARRETGEDVTVVGTPIVNWDSDFSSDPSITFVADTSEQKLVLEVTGLSAENITWTYESKTQSTVSQEVIIEETQVVESVPIGSYVYVQDDLSGAEIPDSDKYIRLTAGEDGSGQYNEGKLDNESISGSSPLIEATADIADSSSPMFGQTVHLINTEEAFLRPRETAGELQFDQMQKITGDTGANHMRMGNTINGINLGNGALSITGNSPNGRGSAEDTSYEGIAFDSSNSPDARTSDTTDGETRPKNLSVTAYMRIK